MYCPVRLQSDGAECIFNLQGERNKKGVDAITTVIHEPEQAKHPLTLMRQLISQTGILIRHFL